LRVLALMLPPREPVDLAPSVTRRITWLHVGSLLAVLGVVSVYVLIVLLLGGA
jgi:hypothetical protein